MVNLNDKTKKNLLQEMLVQIPNTFDKRDTSPIQTALGPAAYALEEFYLNLDQIQKGAYISSATGSDLDALAVIGNVTRYPASPAVRMGIFNAQVPVGARFSTVNGADSINFSCTGSYTRTMAAAVDQAEWTASPLGGNDGTFTFTYDGGWTYSSSPVSLSDYGISVSGTAIDGDRVIITVSSGTAGANYSASTSGFTYTLVAETAGTIGNDYAGTLLPISIVPGLTQASIADILVLGDDEETDDALRSRLITSLTDRPFAGNIASYRDAAMAIDGVGGVQVYPTWTGGGTVKLSVIGTDFEPASASVIAAVQAAIDPAPGEGLGTAPIGAVVTVVAPTSVDIDIAATIVLNTGYTLEQVTPLIAEAITLYIDSVKREWDTQLGSITVEYAANIYYARILAAIVSVQGVVNVSSLTVNGDTSDIVLTETGATQEIPKVGSIVISD